MNQNAQDVKVPKGAKVGELEVLRHVNTVIGETASDTGHLLMLEDGSTVFVTNSQFEKLGEKEDK